MRLATGVLGILVGFIGCTPEVTREATEETVATARPAPPASAPIEETLAWLADEVSVRSPGTELAIAFDDLQTGARVAISGDAVHVSASSAKAWWVAAALYGTSVAAVQPYANPIFVNSDNGATGAAIDLVGPNYVNAFMWDVAGMPASALTQWSYGRNRVATNSPRVMGSDNYATADDAVTFLARLHRRELLDDERSQTLLSWMTRAPRGGVGGWLGARLPAAAGVAHKGGWLPPGCCSDDRRYNTLNEIGIVTAPDGRAYAVTIFTRHGFDYWNKQARFVELASCSIYRAFIQDEALDCARAGDPVPTASCGDVSYQGYCDGANVVWCENASLQRKDCAGAGQVCAWQSDDIGYNCTAPAAAATCGDLSYQGACEDQTVVWCEGGAVRRKDCAAIGKACTWQNDEIGFNCL